MLDVICSYFFALFVGEGETLGRDLHKHNHTDLKFQV